MCYWRYGVVDAAGVGVAVGKGVFDLVGVIGGVAGGDFVGVGENPGEDVGV